MKTSPSRFTKHLVLLCAGMLMMLGAAAQDLDFLERFALGENREEVLKELVPGTQEYYFYHCLHYQNTGKLDEADKVLLAWHQMDENSPGLNEMRNRQALLRYGELPEVTLEYLRQKLGLHFNHQREVAGAKSNLPTALDPTAISRATLTKRALSLYDGRLEGFEDSALEWLVEQDLGSQALREWLSRLTRPDFEPLPRLVLAELQAEGSGGFGSLPIHRNLLLSQLDELLRLEPDLLNNGEFVNVYISKLAPSADENWRVDPVAKQAYLDRLEAFTSRLSPVHNSLKACVLYQRLIFDRTQGARDKNRFMAYIQLPRNVAYISRDFMKKPENRNFVADFGQSYCGLPPITDDQGLVRDYLEHFFVTEESHKPYIEFLDEDYLKRVFAETKILHGIGDLEKWAAWLTPGDFQQLKERVEIEFDPANRERYGVGDPAKVTVWTKNVGTLIVKVFEVNTGAYYRQYEREVNTDIDLDGLVANEEQVYTCDEPPYRKVERTFEFPGIDHRGVYVIEIIGNGKSSRAIIRKGGLTHLVRTGTAGQVFVVLDENGAEVKDAAIWMAGHEYKADEEDRVTLPFSTEPGEQLIVLSDGAFSDLARFNHQGEVYSLSAGFIIDRESLRQGSVTEVGVRPALYLNGTPVTLSVLEEPKLIVTSTSNEGIASTREVAGFELFEDRLSVHEFRVPEGLSQLGFTLTAKIKPMTNPERVDLAASQAVNINQIDTTYNTECVFLTKTAGEYFLELFGKTGEVKNGRPLNLELKHRDFRDTASVSLQTDDAGRAGLGRLEDIDWLQVASPDGATRTWKLASDAAAYPSIIQGAAGETLYLPYVGDAPAPVRTELALLELRGGYQADRFTALSIENGFIAIAGLEPGDYELTLKKIPHQVSVRVTKGEKSLGYAMGAFRRLQQINTAPVQVTGIEPADDSIRVSVANASPVTRVHVLATRFVPVFSEFARLSIPSEHPGASYVPPILSVYTSERAIGDEYQYILDRKYADKYPGNMLDRPGLLLNPWALTETETGSQEAAAGEAPPAASMPQLLAEEAPGAAEGPGGPVGDVDYANLDFLGGDPAVFLNLQPDANGVVTVPRKELGGRHHIHVFVADPRNTVYRQAALSDDATPFRDLRLAEGIDPKTHATEQKRITVLKEGDALTLQGSGALEFEVYDTIGKVYALYNTLLSDPKLTKFGFVTRWPELTDEQKREKYSEFACHELNLFLQRKDPAFFEAVVKPLIANKLDKTFVDRYLLGDDLGAWLDPWRYGQLNVPERILLAERIVAERDNTVRFVKDRYNLIPPDVDRFNHLFMTALRGRSLEVAAGGGGGSPSGGLGGMALDRLELGGKVVAGADFDVNGVMLSRPASEADRLPAPAPPAEAEELAEQAARKADVAQAGAVELKALGYFAKDEGGRARYRALYTAMEKTREWVENNYYELPIEQQTADLIAVSAFWRDYAERDTAAPFLSSNLADASRNFPEMMFALAVLDLPFEAKEHKVEQDGAKIVLTASGPAVVFHKEVTPVEPRQDAPPILVSQNFFRLDDRFRMVDNERVDKFVTGEFLKQVVYGCQVVATNPTSSRQRLDVLLQIPEGAVPIERSKYLKTHSLALEPYNTATLEYYFYFPGEGTFEHFPVHVAKGGELVAFGSPVTMNVVAEPSTVDKTSWAYISQHGSDEDVYGYLQNENIHAVDLDLIAWRMKDAAVFTRTLELLRQRRAFSPTLWSYAIQHNNAAAVREYLQFRDDFVSQCGAAIDSPLLTLDPVLRKTYQHMEYSPLVNARAHKLGPRRVIVNERLAAQYTRLLNVLACRPVLDQHDLMSVTYYLLLQDKIEDGLAYLAKVQPAELDTRLQYDYFACCAAFYTEEPDKAAAIASSYEAYPVDRWRKLFANVLAQAEEITSARTAVINEKSREQLQDQLAQTEPDFEFKVEAKQITVTYQNLAACRVAYYPMDVEMLFSRSPFVKQGADHFSTIRPNFVEDRELPADQTTATFDLPERFRSSNVMVEITAGGKKKTQAYYASNLAVQVIENYGQLRVTSLETGQPLPKVYVKAYARMQGGEVKFYKDGYTDLRGRFDYSSLNTDELDYVERFALLILSETDGAAVREAAPPKR